MVGRSLVGEGEEQEVGRSFVSAVEEQVMERLVGVEKRQFECCDVTCRRKFVREYDLQRHLTACHPTDELV